MTTEAQEKRGHTDPHTGTGGAMKKKKLNGISRNVRLRGGNMVSSMRRM